MANQKDTNSPFLWKKQNPNELLNNHQQKQTLELKKKKKILYPKKNKPKADGRMGVTVIKQIPYTIGEQLTNWKIIVTQKFS